jgi:hypothetical protein
MKKQLFVLLICTMSVSCSKFVETRTPDSLFDGTKVFENDNSAIAVVNSILADLGKPLR